MHYSRPRHRRASPARQKPHTTWSDYGGGSDGSQYSALTQINRSNVNSLQIAWTNPTGDATNYLFNPVVVDGVMYVLAKNHSIVALDAATGKEVWVHPNSPGPTRTITRGKKNRVNGVKVNVVYPVE